MLKKNISDGVGSRNESIDTPLDPPLFWLDNIFKRLYSLSVFFMQAKILLAYSETTSYIENYLSKSLCSPCTLDDFWRILGRRSNTFGVFSEYVETLLAYSQNSHKGQRIS